jgi:hypothetical protein
VTETLTSLPLAENTAAAGWYVIVLTDKNDLNWIKLYARQARNLQTRGHQHKLSYWSNSQLIYRLWNKPGWMRVPAIPIITLLCMVMDKHDKIPEISEAVDFVRACDYYLQGLFAVAFQSAKAELQPFLDEAAYFGMKTPTMGEFLAESQGKIDQLAADIQEMK